MDFSQYLETTKREFILTIFGNFGDYEVWIYFNFFFGNFGDYVDF